MHETDAMQFIKPVLEGFFDRNFKLNGSEDDHFIELCLDEVRDFIRDTEPHWVKEKAFQIVENIETAECHIRLGLYTPSSAGDFLSLVLNKAKKKIKEDSEYHRLENNKGKTSIFVPMPLFT